MVIGFEGKRAVCNTTGLGNYSRLLINELSNHFPRHQYIIYSSEPDRQHRLDDLLKRDNVILRLPQRTLLGKSAWRTICGLSSQAEREGVDILHGLSAELPLDLAKHSLMSIVTVHDLIFCRFPQFYDPINTAIYKFKCRSACKIADKIIAVSDCTKRDIIKFFGIPSNKIEVVYQGCDSIFSEPISTNLLNEVKSKYSLPKQYFLNVGTIEERKNILLAVRALEKLDNKSIPLIIIGRKTRYADTVAEYAKQYGLQKRVRFLHDVPSSHLPAIYHLSTAFIYPSRYEGFGIPIIEAQSCDAPIITATGSCLEEAAGPNALFVNPDSVEDMINHMTAILRDDALRCSLINSGRENIKRFEQTKLTNQVMSIYQSVLNPT